MTRVANQAKGIEDVRNEKRIRQLCWAWCQIYDDGLGGLVEATQAIDAALPNREPFELELGGGYGVSVQFDGDDIMVTPMFNKDDIANLL